MKGVRLRLAKWLDSRLARIICPVSSTIVCTCPPEIWDMCQALRGYRCDAVRHGARKAREERRKAPTAPSKPPPATSRERESPVGPAYGGATLDPVRGARLPSLAGTAGIDPPTEI